MATKPRAGLAGVDMIDRDHLCGYRTIDDSELSTS